MTSFKLISSELPETEEDIHLKKVLGEQQNRVKKYSIPINPYCHVQRETKPIGQKTNIVRHNNRVLCVSCGNPTNTFSKSGLFGIQPFCGNCRDLRNMTHWKSIGEALSTKTWSRKVWRDRKQISRMINGGI